MSSRFPFSGPDTIESDSQAAASRSETSMLERVFNPASTLQYSNPYLQLSTTLTYSYLLVLPLLLLYELGSLLLNTGPGGVRISADILVKQVLGLVGIDSTFGFGIVVLILGIGIILYERRQGITISPRYLALMGAESIAYALLLGMFVGILVGTLFGSIVSPAPLQMPGQDGGSVLSGLILSLGAGVYEELIFRVFLVSILYASLFFIRDNRWVRYGIAAVIGALIFSAVHYTGSMAYDFTFSSFIFRFLMGLGLNALLLFRGFGITAAAHAFFDVYVTLFG